MPRPRKPTEQKELNGSADHDPQRINKLEPRLDPVELKPPTGLSPEAKKEWRDIVPVLCQQMRVLTDADRGVLLGYCTAFGDLIWAEREIAKKGRIIEVFDQNEDGEQYLKELRVNEAMRIKEKALANMRGYAQVLGLSPADRSRVAAIKAAGETDPMLRLIQGGRKNA